MMFDDDFSDFELGFLMNNDSDSSWGGVAFVDVLQDLLKDPKENYFGDLDDDFDLFASDDPLGDDDSLSLFKEGKGKTPFHTHDDFEQALKNELFTGKTDITSFLASHPDWEKFKNLLDDEMTPDGKYPEPKAEFINPDDPLPWQEHDEEDYENDEIATFEKIHELRQRIADGDIHLRGELARMLTLYASDPEGDLPPGEMTACLDEALQIFKELIEQGQPEFRIAYGRVMLQQAVFQLMDTEKETLSMTQINETIQYARTLIDNCDDKIDAADLLATAYRLQGDFFEKNGIMSASLSSRLQAAEIWEKLIIQGEMQFRSSLAFTCQSIGAAYFSIGDLQPAVKTLQRSLELWDEIKTEDESALPEIVNIYSNLQEIYYRLGDAEKAVACVNEAMKREYALVQTDRQEYIGGYVQVLENKAELLIHLRRIDEALDLQLEILDQYDSLLENPVDQMTGVSHPFVRKAEIYRERGTVLQTVERFPEAHEALRLGLKNLLLAKKKLGLDIRPLVLGLAITESNTLLNEQNLDDSLKVTRLLVDLIEKILPDAQPQVQITYPQVLHLYAHILVRMNQTEEVLPVLDKCVEYWHNNVVEQGKIEYQSYYAAAIGERAAYCLRSLNDYDHALDDIVRARYIFQELVESSNGEKSLCLYMNTIRDHASTLIGKKEPFKARDTLQCGFDTLVEYLAKRIPEALAEFPNIIKPMAALLGELEGNESARRLIERGQSELEKLKTDLLADPAPEEKTSGTVEIQKAITPEQIDKTMLILRCEQLSRLDQNEEARTEIHNCIQVITERIYNGDREDYEFYCTLFCDAISLLTQHGDINECCGMVDALINQLKAGRSDTEPDRFDPCFPMLYELKISLTKQREGDHQNEIEALSNEYLNFCYTEDVEGKTQSTFRYIEYFINRALALCEAKNQDEAEAILEKILPVLEKLAARGILDARLLLGNTWYNLAGMQCQSRRLDSAFANFRKAFDIYKQCPPGSHDLDVIRNRADTCRILGTIATSRFDNEEAQSWFARAREGYERVLEIKPGNEVRFLLTETLFRQAFLFLHETSFRKYEKGIRLLQDADDNFDEIPAELRLSSSNTQLLIWVELVSYYLTEGKKDKLDPLFEKMGEFFDAIENQSEFAANASHITHLMVQKSQWLVRQRDFEEAEICINKFYHYVEIFKLAGNDPLDCLHWTVAVEKANMLLERQSYNETILFVCQCLPQLKRQIAKAERRFKQEENKDDKKLLVTLLQCWVTMEKYRGQAWLRQDKPRRSLWVFNAILPPCRRLIELQSDNAILLAMIQGERTEAYSQIRRYKKAIQSANEAIRLFSERSFRQTPETDIVYASVLRHRAAACWKIKLYVRGIADCKSGIAALADQVELNVSEAVAETAALYFQRALIHFDVGDRESTAREICRVRELVQRPCVVQLPEIVLMIAQAKVIFERLRIRR